MEDYHLRRGEEFIAAGLFLIPTGMFVLALKESGAWRFIKDNAGIYVRPERITLPEESASWELSYNAGHRAAFKTLSDAPLLPDLDPALFKARLKRGHGSMLLWVIVAVALALPLIQIGIDIDELKVLDLSLGVRFQGE